MSSLLLWLESSQDESGALGGLLYSQEAEGACTQREKRRPWGRERPRGGRGEPCQPVGTWSLLSPKAVPSPPLLQSGFMSQQRPSSAHIRSVPVIPKLKKLNWCDHLATIHRFTRSSNRCSWHAMNMEGCGLGVDTGRQTRHSLKQKRERKRHRLCVS